MANGGGDAGKGVEVMELTVAVPYGTTVEIVMPTEEGERRETVRSGTWSFQTKFRRSYEWPVLPLKPKS